MQDRDLYAQILGIAEPWIVAEVRLDQAGGEVVIRLAVKEGASLACPECGRNCPGYDRQPRRWRHLDTCQFRTILDADVPRCRCPEHGVKQVRTPWAEPGGRFTALFERLAIGWMQEVGRSAAARQLRLSWDEADTIYRRAVARGLKRRDAAAPAVLGVDEKSFQRHDYVTVLCDLATGAVLHVADGRGTEAMTACCRSLAEPAREAVEAIAMDMHEPYARAARSELPNATIVYDKFHVAKLAGEAVDQVRRREAKALAAHGDERLKRTRWAWLRNPVKESAEQRRAFDPLRRSHLKTARAWAIKETLMDFFRYARAAAAKKHLERWIGWAARSRLAPMQRLGRTIKSRMTTLLNWCRWPITNAAAEALNSKIQWVKYTARGFRSKDGFRTAIYFHCGKLNMYPH